MRKTRASARAVVGLVLDDFLKHPNVTMRVLRDHRAPGGLRTEVAPTCLLGGLALTLLRRIQGVEPALKLCAGGCGELIVPERPSPTRKAWCPRCRNTRAQKRIVEAESRARRR